MCLWGHRWIALGIGLAVVVNVAGAQIEADDQPQQPGTGEAARSGLEEIVVTATKRRENLQDVSVSLNVVTGDLLEQSQENELSRLTKFDPSFRFLDSGNDVARSISIRGVGTQTFSRGVEQSVGTAVDGVVSDTLASSLLDFGDVERIEVLRGPQGLLFGKNASAGLLNIVTRDPTWEFEAGVDTSWADGNEIKVSGFLSGPLFEDKLAGRISFFRNKRDPYIENLGGRDTNDRDEWALRGKLDFRPTDDLRFLFAYWHAERSPQCCGGPAADVVEGGIADLAGVPVGPKNDVIDNGAESWNVTRLNTYMLNATWDIGDYNLTSITAYTDGYGSADARLIFPFESEGFLDPNLAVSEVQLVTQELRLASPLGGFVEWLGGFYFYEKKEEFNLNRNADLFYIGSASAPDSFGTSLINSVRYTNTSYALFGNLTFNLADWARLIGGARWNYDDVSTQQTIDYDPTVFPNTIPESGQADGLPNSSSDTLDDHGISWRVAAEFDATEDAMLFASAAQGYKGPAANTLPTGVVAIEPIIDPEIATNFEIGLKSQWWDRRVKLNASVFYTEFEDFQTAATRIDPTTELLGFFLANAGSLETKGVEVDAAVQPLPNLTLTFVGAYIDAVFKEYTGAPCYQGQTVEEGCMPGEIPGANSQDLSGTQLGNSPDWSFTVGGLYGLPINDDWNSYLLGSYRWQDTMITGTTGSPRTRIDSYGLMDLAVGVNSADDRWGLQVFAKNLFDTFYETGAIPADIVGINRGHSLAYTYTRRIGVAARVRF